MTDRFVILSSILMLLATAATASVHGRWQGGCHPTATEKTCYILSFDEMTNRATRGYQVYKALEDPYRYVYAYDRYNGLQFTIRYNNRYNIPEAWELDWRVDSNFLVLRNEHFVREFNEQQECGFSDWELDVPKAITGISCLGFHWGIQSRWHPELVGIKGNEIYFGHLGPIFDPIEEFERPIELSPVPTATRIER